MENEKEKLIWGTDVSASRRISSRGDGREILNEMAKEKQAEHEKFVEELEELLKNYDKDHR